MARPERNNVDYFPHEVIHGKKMFVIEKRYGNDGYSVWFKLLEQLGKADFHYLDINDKTQKMYLASEFNVTEENMTNILNDLADLNAIHSELYKEHGIIFSEKFVLSIIDAYSRRRTNCLHLSSLCVHLSIKLKQKDVKKDINTQSIVKYNKVKNTKLLMMCPFYEDIDFQEVWSEFEKVRDKKRAIKSERAYLILLKKMMAWSEGKKGRAIVIVEKSAMSGWADLYEINDNPKQINKKPNKFEDGIEKNRDRTWNN